MFNYINSKNEFVSLRAIYIMYKVTLKFQIFTLSYLETSSFTTKKTTFRFYYGSVMVPYILFSKSKFFEKLKHKFSQKF